MRLEQIYQEVILDHYKRPHHRGLREPYCAQVSHVNPTCGDEVTLRVALSQDGQTVTDISYDGQGCSISQASTSVLTDQVIGQNVGDALKTVAAFSEMISSRGAISGDEFVGFPGKPIEAFKVIRVLQVATNSIESITQLLTDVQAGTSDARRQR